MTIVATNISGQVLQRIDFGSLSLIETEYPPGLHLSRHTHGDGILTLPVTGTYKEVLDTRHDQCVPGALRLLLPSVPHENDYPEGAICLHLKIAASLLLSERFQFALQYPSGKLENMGQAWKLYREYTAFDDFSPLIIEAFLCEVLAESSRALQQPRRSIPAWLLQAKEILHECHETHVTLADLARQVGVHQVHLCREFKRHFGCTAGEFLRRIRVDRACELLLKTQRTISDVSFACGFFDQSHFCSVFKKLTGTTPAQFRRHGVHLRVKNQQKRRAHFNRIAS